MSLKRFLENNNVGHKITIRPDAKHDREKFLTACTCGTEGRFVTLDEAKQYAQIHCGHYGLDPAKCITILDTPYVVPGLPGQPKAAAPFAYPGPERRKAIKPIQFADRRSVPCYGSSGLPPYAKGGAASSAPSQAPPYAGGAVSAQAVPPYARR
jgi:hypothetical protein